MKDIKKEDIKKENIKDISLLSVEEAKGLPKDILATDRWWWLQSPAPSVYSNFAISDGVIYVNSIGDIDEYGDSVNDGDNTVRPVLYTNLKSSNLTFGKVYHFFDEDWYYIGGGRFLIKDNIGNCRFDEKSNDYEKSEIKECLEKWLEIKLKCMKEPETIATNNVDHPSHYTSGKIECIDAIKESMELEAYKGFLKGNVLKYVWRYEKKTAPLEDLKKAQWYLEKLIDEEDINNGKK